MGRNEINHRWKGICLKKKYFYNKIEKRWKDDKKKWKNPVSVSLNPVEGVEKGSSSVNKVSCLKLNTFWSIQSSAKNRKLHKSRFKVSFKILGL